VFSCKTVSYAFRALLPFAVIARKSHALCRVRFPSITYLSMCAPEKQQSRFFVP